MRPRAAKNWSRSNRLSSKIAAETIDPAHAPEWAKTIGGDSDKLEAVLAQEDAISGDSAASFA